MSYYQQCGWVCWQCQHSPQLLRANRETACLCQRALEVAIVRDCIVRQTLLTGMRFPHISGTFVNFIRQVKDFLTFASARPSSFADSSMMSSHIVDIRQTTLTGIYDIFIWCRLYEEGGRQSFLTGVRYSRHRYLDPHPKL